MTAIPISPADSRRQNQGGSRPALEYESPCPPLAHDIAGGTTHDPIDLHVQGEVDLLIREITIPVGGTTGWHYHPGHVLGVVEQGTLVQTCADGRTRVFRRGDAFLQPSGQANVHEGRNVGDDPVIVHATCLSPADYPLAIPALPPSSRDET
ncbi:cupin domain-containing protein [Streptomyces sp. NBC_01619]|uniref:cupin domain-containing protein n=1 Tax=Streptomyces sp. NBC_01619 TaxID=2975901 RepID=UPI00338F29A5